MKSCKEGFYICSFCCIIGSIKKSKKLHQIQHVVTLANFIRRKKFTSDFGKESNLYKAFKLYKLNTSKSREVLCLGYSDSEICVDDGEFDAEKLDIDYDIYHKLEKKYQKVKSKYDILKIENEELFWENRNNLIEIEILSHAQDSLEEETKISSENVDNLEMFIIKILPSLLE